MLLRSSSFFFFFFNDTATTEIYTLSLHDALPILNYNRNRRRRSALPITETELKLIAAPAIMGLSKIPMIDRKSTRLNSSHSQISYAVFCLKKKKIKNAV